MSTNALMLEMQKKKTSHVLHLVLSLITGGLWILIWICCAIANASHNRGIDRRIARIYEWEGSRSLPAEAPQSPPQGVKE